MQTQYECRKSLKQYSENKEVLLFFSSGVFFRTFDTDAEFLSAMFGFKIMQKWAYGMVGLPHQSEMKYFSQLQAQGYAYQILKYEAEELIVMDTFEGLQPLKYDPTCLVYREKSEKSKADENVRFTAFLTELSRLIQKYLPPFSW